MTDYKSKYIKYKNKYLKLKEKSFKIIGGMAEIYIPKIDELGRAGRVMEDTPAEIRSQIDELKAYDDLEARYLKIEEFQINYKIDMFFSISENKDFIIQLYKDLTDISESFDEINKKYDIFKNDIEIHIRNFLKELYKNREKQTKAEAEAKALAEKQAKAEAEAKALAEKQAKAEAEAKALAEEDYSKFKKLNEEQKQYLINNFLNK